MKICVLNYELAREFEPIEPTLAIRIFDPDCERTDGNNAQQKLKDNPLWTTQLCYTFEDIDLTTVEEDRERFTRLQKGYKCFDILTAKKLVQDFEANYKKATALMIHCNAGISRSVAIAAALIKRFKLNPEWMGRRTRGLLASGTYTGNQWVYHLLLDA